VRVFKRSHFPTLVTSFASALALCCGAQNLPGPEPRPRPQQCRALKDMAPALTEALEGSRAERLAAVVERNRLLDAQPDGTPSPFVTLVKIALKTCSAMASDPPEPGAAPGELCSELFPPASKDSNRTCEAQRILRTFVREGKGIEALRLLDPLVASILNYVVGRAPAATTPHYEVSASLAATCTKAYCRTEDMLDLFIGVMAALEPTSEEPRRAVRVLAQLNALLTNPETTKVFTALESSGWSDDDFVAFTNILLDNVMALPADPEGFADTYHRELEVRVNDLLTTVGITREKPEYKALREALDALLGSHENLSQPHGDARPLIYDMLDPARPEPVLRPLQKVLSCVRASDPNSSIIRMLHSLAYERDLLGLRDLMVAVEAVARIDERVSLATFGKRALQMIRADDEEMAASRKVCATFFDTRPGPEGAASNAELWLPVAADLFQGGAVGEVVCVLDSLLYGCAGGSQPACQR